MRKLLLIAVVLNLLMTACTPQNLPPSNIRTTPIPPLIGPPRFGSTVTPMVTHTSPIRSATALPAVQEKIQVSSDYITGLNEAFAMGKEALQAGIENMSWPKRVALYAQLEHMVTLTTNQKLQAQTARLLVDFKIGLELIDERTVKKALENIRKIREMINN